jgi:hypothetical protein
VGCRAQVQAAPCASGLGGLAREAHLGCRVRVQAAPCASGLGGMVILDWVLPL